MGVIGIPSSIINHLSVLELEFELEKSIFKPKRTFIRHFISWEAL